MTPDQLGSEIAHIVSKPRSILFAGAGVGCRIGLPTWTSWMRGLAGVCCEYSDDLAGRLIESRVEKGEFLGAATVYKTCTGIPAGERLQRMAAPFRATADETTLALLECLVRLPITGIVTTNYDRSLHQACARFLQTAPHPLELHDGTLRNGALISDFFIARIHGRAEVPQSMVVDTADYDILQSNLDYNDFLVTLMRQRPILFVGFSFLDPALNSVLALYERNFGPNFPSLHTAVVPHEQDSQLQRALGRVNIRVLTYDPLEEHKDLWRAVRLASIDPVATQLSLKIRPILPIDLLPSELHRVVAFAYATSKTPEFAMRPALHMVQDGVLLAILRDEPSEHLEKSTAIEKLRTLLRIDEQTAISFFSESLERLKAANEIRETDSYISRRTRSPLLLHDQLRRLSRGVTNRITVIQGIRAPNLGLEALDRMWEELFIVRAWDLAAQYAGSIASRGMGIEACVGALAERHFGDVRNSETVADTFLDVINTPEEQEATALAEISRTAITVSVLFSSTRFSLSHAYTIPTKIYFDASVLLPAIVDGHPMQTGYLAAIRKLQDAAKKTGLGCELCVTTAFLEEMVKHRENAIELVQEADLENHEALSSHIIFHGVENTNVFVGAFSVEFTGVKGQNHSFRRFLARVAPYTNTSELVFFLKSKGISSEELNFVHKNNVEFTHIYNRLTDGYERQSAQFRKVKEKVLIVHEAEQLTRLFLDLTLGKRSVFVTADAKLQRIVQNSEHLEKLTGNVLSQIGFVGLVDLLVGLPPDREVFTRLMWASPRNDTQKQVRDYLVSVTLARYDDAMARAMPEVLRDFMASARDELSAFDRQSRKTTDPEDVKATKLFLDRLENQYFEKMRKVIESRTT